MSQGVEACLSLMGSELSIVRGANDFGSSERLLERESRLKNASLSNTFSTLSSPGNVSIVDISRD